MSDDLKVEFNMSMPPPSEAEAREADRLAIGIFMLAEKWNASPQVLLYTLHRVLDKMGTMARNG